MSHDVWCSRSDKESMVAPAPLPEALFSGSGEVPTGELARAVVRDLGPDLDRMLAAFGLGGDQVAVVGLSATADGRQVVDGRLLFRGAFEKKEVTFAAARFWQEADEDVEVTICLPDPRQVEFSEGSLVSAFIPDGAVAHAFFRQPEAGERYQVASSDREEFGARDFSLRVICHLDKSCGAKNGIVLRYYFVLYPASEEAMAAIAPNEFRDPGWPGFRLADGRVGVGPRPALEWRCPVLPAVMVSGAAYDARLPSPGVLRAAIAGIMRTGGVPDGCKNFASLREKWDKVRLRTLRH